VLENDEIVAGIPLAYDKQNKINVPPLTRTLGVLYKNQDNKSFRKRTSEERRWLSELIKDLSPDDFIQMCMHHNFTDWLPFRWKGFSQTTRYTYILNYENKTSDELWHNLDSENRRIIKRAAENEIRTEFSDDIESAYHYESLSYERQGLKFNMPYNDLKILDDAIREMGNRIIFKAIDKSKKVHAVLYVVFNKKSAYALLSGSDANLRNLGGHTLVMWEAIRYFKDKVEYFNFGGSDIERIEAHLRGFGGILTPYFQIYNAKLFRKEDFRYQFRETALHFKLMCKILKNKIIKPRYRK
jgi:lipid II:glycine glycyltransferase (peptidoglycan interpeptide bridge formation enzyme)